MEISGHWFIHGKEGGICCRIRAFYIVYEPEKFRSQVGPENSRVTIGDSPRRAGICSVWFGLGFVRAKDSPGRAGICSVWAGDSFERVGDSPMLGGGLILRLAFRAGNGRVLG